MIPPPEPPITPRHAGVAFAANASGDVVSPYTAPRGQRYTCLACAEEVILRRGRVRVPHFAHRPDSTCSASGESIEHAAFKRLLAAGLRAHRRFTAQVRCPACGHDQTTTYPLADGSEVREEVAVEGFRADVGVLRGDRVVLAFEVYVTHQVDGEKALGLQTPWLEVAAHAGGVQDPGKRPSVRVLDTNLFRHRPCKACGSSAGSNAEAEHAKLLAQEAAWREEEVRKKALEAEREQQRARERRREEPQRPSCWVTAFVPQYAAYRAPLHVRVLGVPLLVHPSLLPAVTLSEAHGGKFVLRQYALRFVSDSGREEYAGGRIGEFLEDLLLRRRPATTEAEQLLTDVRSVLQQVREKPGGQGETRQPATGEQPTLWESLQARA